MNVPLEIHTVWFLVITLREKDARPLVVDVYTMKGNVKPPMVDVYNRKDKFNTTSSPHFWA